MILDYIDFMVSTAVLKMFVMIAMPELPLALCISFSKLYCSYLDNYFISHLTSTDTF